MPEVKHDYSEGTTYGRLALTGSRERRKQKSQTVTYLEARCSCGTIRWYAASNITGERTKDCGCVRAERRSEFVVDAGRRVCNTCREIKTLAEFPVDPKKSSGRRGVCNTCQAAKIRARRAASPEAERHKQRRWRANNPDKAKASSLRYTAKASTCLGEETGCECNACKAKRAGMIQRRCRICQCIKPLESFHKHPRGPGGRLSRCKDCLRPPCDGTDPACKCDKCIDEKESKGVKYCRGCGRTRPFDCFKGGGNKHGRITGKLRSRCRECERAEYQAKDKAELAAKREAKLAAQDVPASKPCTCCRRELPLTAFSPRLHGRYGTVPWCRECQRKKEKLARATPASILRRAHRRKVLKLGGVTGEDIVALYEAQDGRCHYCEKSVGSDFHVDHVVPISRGGQNEPSNIVIACPSCNMRKWALPPEEFTRRQAAR